MVNLYLNDTKKNSYCFVFDAKFDGRRKARLVTGGHRAPDVSREESYSGVVPIEIIVVAFILLALSDVEVCAEDRSTAFLYVKTRENIFIYVGPKFGKNEGKVHLIDKDYNHHQLDSMKTCFKLESMRIQAL